MVLGGLLQKAQYLAEVVAACFVDVAADEIVEITLSHGWELLQRQEDDICEECRLFIFFLVILDNVEHNLFELFWSVLKNVKENGQQIANNNLDVDLLGSKPEQIVKQTSQKLSIAIN